MIKFSVLIPTYNNLNYLKLAINSIKDNSIYEHEIILHINDGSDGTLNYAKSNKLIYTYSNDNIGLCSAINKASTKVSTQYVLYVHDDMYLCKNWDQILENEIKSLDNDLFYFSGTNYENRDIDMSFNPGNSPEQFNPNDFHKFCVTKNEKDLQGSHWAPHIISKRLWDVVGGFSEEFNPGDGSDSDFNMKLWKVGVRFFKGLNQFKVYHFGSISMRKKADIVKNDGTKIFLKKWGITPKFFFKYYLRTGDRFDGLLNNPSKNINFYMELLVCKIKKILS